MLRIETQDEILGSINAERIVEVGPANILTNMMKRTQSMLYHEKDLVCGLNRQILGPQTDLDEIYMRHATQYDLKDDGEQSSTSDATKVKTSQVPAAPESDPPPSQPTATSAIPSAPAKQLEDTELPVTRILWAIVASKLKKDISSIPTHATISSLVGGKKDVAPIIQHAQLTSLKGDQL